MTKFKESDYTLLKEFPLFWRWSDKRWNELPQAILQLIHPLNAKLSFEYHKQSLSISTDIENGKTFDCEVGKQQTKEWLSSLHLSNTEQIIISWDKSNCVVTTGAVFIQYWDDFCYTSSDDVVIWSEESNWVLLYHHSNSFTLTTKAVHLTSRSS
jgi:hypothetical protein